MELAEGTKLGPYEIVAPVGAGGMGQVWKARDTRLERIVAIKTSQVQFSAGRYTLHLSVQLSAPRPRIFAWSSKTGLRAPPFR